MLLSPHIKKPAGTATTTALPSTKRVLSKIDLIITFPICGVGIGGDFEQCAFLSKKALCRDITLRNQNTFYAELEKELLEKINELGIGPQGFGGDTTALAVNIEYAATHIAGLPLAVNIGCHVTRHATAEV